RSSDLAVDVELRMSFPALHAGLASDSPNEPTNHSDTMPENLNMDEVMQARRKSVAGTIRPIAIDELKTLGNELFPTFDHPWREVYFNFVTENANASFYHAVADDGIHIIYCHTKEKG